jgi:hypothetical protein
MVGAESKLALLAALTLCSCAAQLGDAADSDDSDVSLYSAGGVKLGMNPRESMGGGGGDWPVAGSSTSLSMARVWDMGVTWAQIEPTAPDAAGHHYNWAALDAIMGNIIAADMRPMYVLFGVPTWAAAGCTSDPKIGGGCAVYPDDPANWSAFTRAVAARYAGYRNSSGLGPVYEVWNEPNLGPGSSIVYWRGTSAQLFDLNRRAWIAVKAAAPGDKVICCGWNRLAARNSSSDVDAWLSLGGGDHVDAVSYHPYPTNWDPSTAGSITRDFSDALARHGVQKRLWATEVGFLNGWGIAPRALTHADQAALVTQTIDALQAKSVPVVIWYPWDETHVGFAESNMVGLHRVVAEAVAAAKN